MVENPRSAVGMLNFDVICHIGLPVFPVVGVLIAWRKRIRAVRCLKSKPQICRWNFVSICYSSKDTGISITSLAVCQKISSCNRVTAPSVNSLKANLIHTRIIRNSIVGKQKQESLAIAKTTARCAQYMGALKSFESPRKRPRLLFPKFVKGFCSDPY